MTTTICIPVSRSQHLQALFTALELLECDRGSTNLLVYVDGSPDLYVQTRNYVVESKFNERLCVQGQLPGHPPDHLKDRRNRIAQIHNEIRKLLKPCDYVFLLEDDSIPPANALQVLLRNYQAYPHAGLIEGMQLGRHNIPYIGAWVADDVYEPSKITSRLPAQGVEKIDAGGLYCAMTKYEHYAKDEFRTMGELGPDIEWGLSLRQQGYQNYIDWSVLVDHRTPKGSINLGNTRPVVAKHLRDGDSWQLVV